jgi:hypothetical protein
MKIKRVFNIKNSDQSKNKKYFIDSILGRKFEVVVPMILFSEFCLGDINEPIEDITEFGGTRALDIAVDAEDHIAIEICMALGADANLRNGRCLSPLGRAINSELVWTRAIKLLAREEAPRALEDLIGRHLNSPINGMIAGFQHLSQKANETPAPSATTKLAKKPKVSSLIAAGFTFLFSATLAVI